MNAVVIIPLTHLIGNHKAYCRAYRMTEQWAVCSQNLHSKIIWLGNEKRPHCQVKNHSFNYAWWWLLLYEKAISCVLFFCFISVLRKKFYVRCLMTPKRLPKLTVYLCLAYCNLNATPEEHTDTSNMPVKVHWLSKWRSRLWLRLGVTRLCSYVQRYSKTNSS